MIVLLGALALVVWDNCLMHVCDTLVPIFLIIFYVCVVDFLLKIISSHLLMSPTPGLVSYCDQSNPVQFNFVFSSMVCMSVCVLS